MRHVLIAQFTAGLVLAMSIFIGASAQTGSLAGVPTEIEPYRSWTKMNAILLTDPSNPRAGPKNTFINLNADQLKHVFAPGGRVQKPFPDGTILVRESLDLAAGFVRVLFVQRKDSSAGRTKSWVFTGFTRNTASEAYQPLPIPDPVTRCLDCHAQVRNNDFVFTPYLNRPDPFPARGGGGDRVEIFNNQFGPKDLRVRAGATVVWANYDAVPHDVKAANLSFESGNLPLLGRYLFTFTQPGTYEYFCAVHLEMRGRVIVDR